LLGGIKLCQGRLELGKLCFRGRGFGLGSVNLYPEVCELTAVTAGTGTDAKETTDNDKLANGAHVPFQRLPPNL
jgi:hypothetical protein